MTKKYFARSPNFSDENCGANQNSFDFLKKTVVGSKTCVQRENSLQKTKSTAICCNILIWGFYT
jgi:hypothetical protein